MADYNINEKYTVLDRAKGSAAGELFRVMNLKTDNFFREVPFVQCNRGLSHVFRRDIGMAASTNRAFYTGVGSTKAGSQVVREYVMLKERRREIDEDEIDTLPDDTSKANELRQQDESHIMKLGEEVVDAFFNSGVSDGGEYVRGIKDRLSTLDPDGLDNVKSAGHASATNNSSIYIVEWNPNGGAFGLYPAGNNPNTQYGVSARDKGKEKVLDATASTKAFYAYVAQFKAWLGLAVGDNLKIARVANINSQRDVANNFITGKVDDMLIDLLNKGHFDKSRTRIYVNTSIKTQMDIYAKDKSNVNLTPISVFGEPVMSFLQIPIRVMDNAILTTSEAVVA